MPWRGSIPRTPTLRSRRDDERAQTGNDLIHEAIGSPTYIHGRGTGGLGERAMYQSDLAFAKRFACIGPSAESVKEEPQTFGMTLGEVLAVVRRASLTDREVHVVVRHNEGEQFSRIARDMDVPIEAVSDAYERSMALLGRCVSQSPYFGLSEAYREDLNRSGHHDPSRSRAGRSRY